MTFFGVLTMEATFHVDSVVVKIYDAEYEVSERDEKLLIVKITERPMKIIEKSEVDKWMIIE